VLEVPAAATDRSPAARLAPVWNAALADLIARESAPPLAGAIGEVMTGLVLEWGAVPGDLLDVDGPTIRLSHRLRGAALDWLREAPPGPARAERAGAFALEVARLLGPVVRLRAQMHLEALCPEAQRRSFSGGDRPRALSESVGRLLALIAAGSA